jgi:hypothetical protein
MSIAGAWSWSYSGGTFEVNFVAGRLEPSPLFGISIYFLVLHFAVEHQGENSSAKITQNTATGSKREIRSQSTGENTVNTSSLLGLMENLCRDVTLAILTSGARLSFCANTPRRKRSNSCRMQSIHMSTDTTSTALAVVITTKLMTSSSHQGYCDVTSIRAVEGRSYVCLCYKLQT